MYLILTENKKVSGLGGTWIKNEATIRRPYEPNPILDQIPERFL